MMEYLKVYLQKIEGNEDLPLPSYMTEGAAGVDLCAAINQKVLLEINNRMLFPTGIKVALPVGYEAQVRPRSGLALKHGVTVLNTPGTIDSDYRGEIKVILINLGERSLEINRGDRIAHMVIQRYQTVQFIESGELPSTERNEGGFGHTGR